MLIKCVFVFVYLCACVCVCVFILGGYGRNATERRLKRCLLPLPTNKGPSKM